LGKGKLQIFPIFGRQTINAHNYAHVEEERASKLEDVAKKIEDILEDKKINPKKPKGEP